MTYQSLRRCFLFFSALMILALPAIADAAITVTAPTMTTGSVNDFVVTINAGDTTGQNVTGFDMRLQFDPAVIQPTGTNFGCSLVGTMFAGATVTCNVFPSPNILSINAFAITPVTGSGAIIHITFHPVGASGTSSPLIFNSFMFNEGDPAATTTNGLVNIIDPSAAGVSISGRVLNRYGRPMARARMTLTDSDGVQRNTLTNTFGYFRFLDVPAGRDYVLNTIVKGERFAPQLISLTDDLSGLIIRPRSAVAKGKM